MSTAPILNVEALRELVAAEVAAEVARQLARMEKRVSPFMTVPEAAEYLRTTRARIDNLCSDGTLTRVKDGGRTLLHRSEVEARARPEERVGE